MNCQDESIQYFSITQQPELLKFPTSMLIRTMFYQVYQNSSSAISRTLLRRVLRSIEIFNDSECSFSNHDQIWKLPGMK